MHLCSVKRIGFLYFVVVFIFSGCGTSEFDLSAEEFAMTLDANKNYTLLDVRSSDEFEQAHIANAQLIDINEPLFDSAIAQLDTAKIVYVYCHSGSRSSKAAKIMRKMGFHIYNLDGGIVAWQNAGKPVVASKH